MRLENSFANSWKFAISAFALMSLLLLSAGSTFALPSSGLASSVESLKVADGRGPSASSTTFFHFMAGGLCSKTSDKCIEISGRGTLTFYDDIKANGHLMVYNIGEQSLNALDYSWKAGKVVNANAMRVHFKTTTSLGPIDVAVTEGKTPHTGLVCVWGTLKGVIEGNETLCTNKVLVYIY
jgi:hypothetical protein